jgi:hypothetical protein
MQVSVVQFRPWAPQFSYKHSHLVSLNNEKQSAAAADLAARAGLIAKPDEQKE